MKLIQLGPSNRNHPICTFEREDGRPKEERQVLQFPHRMSFTWAGQVNEDVVQRNGTTDDHTRARNQRAVAQVLQIRQEAGENDRYQDQCHDQLLVQINRIVLQHLLRVLGHEHEINAAKAQLSDTQEPIDCDSHALGEPSVFHRSSGQAQLHGPRIVRVLFRLHAITHQRRAIQEHVLTMHTDDPENQREHG